MFDKLSHFFLRRRNWTLPYALFLLIFAIVPLLLIVLYAFSLASEVVSRRKEDARKDR